jgi:hypothetical protein
LVVIPTRAASGGQEEIHKHDFSHFIDEPPSVAQGGKGVVVPGLPGVLEENQHDEPVPGSFGGGCDAGDGGAACV